jgi:hypothetical protein
MPRSEPPAGKAVKAGELELAWGNAADWKAHWREEALRRHLERPIAERLRAALELVLPRTTDERTT